MVGQRPLLLRALHKHRDRRPNALIDEYHEYLVLIPKENGAAAAGHTHGTDLNFDDGLTHLLLLCGARLYLFLHCVLVRGFRDLAPMIRRVRPVKTCVAWSASELPLLK